MGLRPTSECEFDPDHLYHDHREADELRVEVERVTQAWNSDLTAADAVMIELRAEVERLWAEVEQLRTGNSHGE